MIDAATLRICADGAKFQILEGVKAVHAGELLTAELHFSLAQQALLKLQRLLEDPKPGHPMRRFVIVGKETPDDAA